MQKHKITKKTQFLRRPRSPWLLPMVALAVVLACLFFTVTLHPQASSEASPQANTRGNTIQLLPDTTPIASGATTAPEPLLSTPKSSPTLVPATQQSTRFGVFPLASGGPLPVAETILHPTNIARTQLNNTLISVYAGALTHEPQTGVLCVLREDLATGQVHMQIYQNIQPKGAITILAIQKHILKISNGKAQGTFDLITNQFHW